MILQLVFLLIISFFLAKSMYMLHVIIFYISLHLCLQCWLYPRLPSLPRKLAIADGKFTQPEVSFVCSFDGHWICGTLEQAALQRQEMNVTKPGRRGGSFNYSVICLSLFIIFNFKGLKSFEVVGHPDLKTLTFPDCSWLPARMIFHIVADSQSNQCGLSWDILALVGGTGGSQSGHLSAVSFSLGCGEVMNTMQSETDSVNQQFAPQSSHLPQLLSQPLIFMHMAYLIICHARDDKLNPTEGSQVGGRDGLAHVFSGKEGQPVPQELLSLSVAFWCFEIPKGFLGRINPCWRFLLHAMSNHFFCIVRICARYTSFRFVVECFPKPFSFHFI